MSQDQAPEMISALPGEVLSDAVALFDGTSLEKRQNIDGSAANWKLVDGASG